MIVFGFFEAKIYSLDLFRKVYIFHDTPAVASFVLSVYIKGCCKQLKNKCNTELNRALNGSSLSIINDNLPPTTKLLKFDGSLRCIPLQGNVVLSAASPSALQNSGWRVDSLYSSDLSTSIWNGRQSHECTQENFWRSDPEMSTTRK